MSAQRFAMFMMAPAILFLGVLVAYPILLLVYNSFFEVELIRPEARSWVGLGNYLEVLTSSRVQESALRTVRYMLFALASSSCSASWPRCSSMPSPSARAGIARSSRCR